MDRVVNTSRARVAGQLVLLVFATGAGAAARAKDCQLTILANDRIQYNARALQVDPSCTQIELTLRHVGKEQAHVLGHDWVLARTSDVAALASAGMNAGFDNSYLPAGDKRVIAATKIVGGGDSTTTTFSMSKLAPGVEYSFFCSVPGHTSMMRGRFQVASADDLASNRAAGAAQAAPTR